MLAVAGGHVDAVSLLLEREANVNAANNHGLTALHLGVSVHILPFSVMTSGRLECSTRTIMALTCYIFSFITVLQFI